MMVLSEYGCIVGNEIESIPQVRKECVIDKYVIMPNHIHLIVRIVGDDGNRPETAKSRSNCALRRRPSALQRSLPNMIQGFKGAVTRQIGVSIWQRSYHDHIIRNADSYERIACYIEQNPATWQDDCYYANN